MSNATLTVNGNVVTFNSTATNAAQLIEELRAAVSVSAADLALSDGDPEESEFDGNRYVSMGLLSRHLEEYLYQLTDMNLADAETLRRTYNKAIRATDVSVGEIIDDVVAQVGSDRTQLQHIVSRALTSSKLDPDRVHLCMASSNTKTRDLDRLSVCYLTDRRHLMPLEAYLARKGLQ